MITLDNLEEYGIGNNFQDRVFPQDIDGIVYGDDTEGYLVLEDPETEGGEVPYWKEPSYDRWWKLGLRPTE